MTRQAQQEFFTATLEKSETRAWSNCAGLRVAAATPQIVPGDVETNTSAVCRLMAEAERKQVDVLVFPDLVLSGASCGDLFFQRALQDAVLKGLGRILQESESVEMLICLSLPLPLDQHLLKVSAYIYQGEIVGVHPANTLSSAEQRWFTPAADITGLCEHTYELLIEDPAFEKNQLAEESELLWWQMINKKGSSCPLVTRDLTSFLEDMTEPLTSDDEDNISFACDLSPLEFIPDHIQRYPFTLKESSDVISGLTVYAKIPAADKPFSAGGMRYFTRPQDILDLGEKEGERLPFYDLGQATVPLVAISDFRPEYPLYYRELRSSLLRRSARDESIIVYAAAGESESSSLHVYAGHRLICANGRILVEGEAFESGLTVAELELDKIFAADALAEVNIAEDDDDDFTATREFPFMPPERSDWPEFCYQVLDLQARGLASRLSFLDSRPVLGLSGGVDSTLALLVCLRACRILDRPASDVLAVSMPGPGSSPRSVTISEGLAEACGSDLMTIDISEAVRLHLKDIGHDGSLDHTYENAQARERTQILMDLANMKGAIVVGTGDLSELALGFCTYNGDQMSMYSVNHSVPKTLARLMLDTFAADLLTGNSHDNSPDEYFYLEKSDQRKLANLLREIVSRPVSPELLPPDADGTISQQTEQILGPYEHNDFFLYYLFYDGRHP
ncbi:MAG: NAD(+) synthase, partial [Eubacteriales bacterium]|nr:NAD(+) synthase [Eubacteriales bacterium]